MRMETRGERRGNGGTSPAGGGTAVLFEGASFRGARDGSEGHRVNGTEQQRPSIGTNEYRQPLSSIFHQHSEQEDYTKKLPRNSRRKRRLYFGFSCFSWFFLLLAFLQAALVVGCQVAIAVLGNFRSGRLEEYVECFEESIELDNGSLPLNVTFPTFGRDKEIYVYFFISLVVYSFCLCFYALRVHNIVEVYMFLVINVLAIGYAGVQVFQFRGFGDDCDPITTVGYLALANALMLFVFTIVFVIMSRSIYVEFGWKIYTRVGCNSDLRWYYRVYEVFMSGVKLLILFMLIFLVGQCVLLLYDGETINYEFWIVIFAMIPATFASYPITYWIVRHENIIGSIGLLITDLLIIAYTAYKIYRYATRSCPLCEDLVRELEEEVMLIQVQLNADNSTVAEIIDRIEQFEHLVLLGVINLVIAVLVLVVFLYLLKQYRKGLKEHFASTTSMFSCCNSKGDYDVADGSHKRVFLHLRLRRWNERAHQRLSGQRSTNLAETTSPEPAVTIAKPTRGLKKPKIEVEESERINPPRS
jgi:hypothetical protein